jgi:hypothetical protein
MAKDSKVIDDLPAIPDDISAGGEEKPVEIVEKTEEKEPDVDELKRELEDYRNQLKSLAEARYEAEKRAQEAMQYSVQAANEKMDSDYHLVASALEQSKNNAAYLTNQLAEANAVGDYAKMAEIQRALTRNEIEQNELSRGFERMKNQPRPQYQPQQIQRMEVANPLDELIHVVAKTSPRSAAWLESNRNKITDARMLNKIRRAHEDAIDDGRAVDTDDYFGYVENRLGFVRGSEPLGDDPLSSASAPVTRRSAPPAAPVSRASSPGQNRPGRITLTAEQKEIAEMSKMSYEEYYEQMLREKQKGK